MELRAVLAARGETAEAERRELWELGRMVATVVVQPHLRNRVRPEEVMRLPWDGHRGAEEKPCLTRGEAYARYQELRKRLEETRTTKMVSDESVSPLDAGSGKEAEDEQEASAETTKEDECANYPADKVDYKI